MPSRAYLSMAIVSAWQILHIFPRLPPALPISAYPWPTPPPYLTINQSNVVKKMISTGIIKFKDYNSISENKCIQNGNNEFPRLCQVC